jgi:hypothetical protein
MIAELIENATIYSPPNTAVIIQGGVVGHGFAIEIEDRGLGMSDGKLAEANDQLAEPLPFDPANTDQLGLLVAGQLARRHDIQITLRRNPYGGTTAIVLIPHSIVVAEGFGELEPAKALESAPPPPGRHALGEQNDFVTDEDAEPGFAHDDMPGEPAGAVRHDQGLPPFEAAPPAPAVAPPRAEAGAAPPWPDPDAQAWAQAESRAWTGMESPAWSEPRPPGDTPAWDEAGEGPELPHRVRQASLVPQLREAPPAYPPLPGRFPDPRSPDDARATVSAIQHGWERGRSLFDPAGQPPESGTGHGEGGDQGAYHQEMPGDERGPHGPG